MKDTNSVKTALMICSDLTTGRAGCQKCFYYKEDRWIGCLLHLHKDALELIEELQAKIPQWISVKERLPENDDYYLTYTTEHTCEVYRYDGDGEWVTAWDDTANHDITHWMPLPEPPKEE